VCVGVLVGGWVGECVQLCMLKINPRYGNVR